MGRENNRDGAARPYSGGALCRPPRGHASGKDCDHKLPHDVLTAELMEDVFDLRCPVVPDPVTGTPGGTTRLASLCQLVVSMKETTHIGCFSFNKEPCINRIISTYGIV